MHPKRRCGRVLGGSARWAFVLWVVFCRLGGVTSLPAETLRVASYNLRNYLLADRMVDKVFRREYPKPESEKDALRTVIKEASADVLAIQEIGSEMFLEELQSDLKVYQMDYPHAAWMQGTDEKRHLAVLSKIPFTRVERHADLDFKYFDGRERLKRGLLEVVFEHGGDEWSVFVVHLKSRWSDRDDDPDAAKWRIGEAEAIRRFLFKRYSTMENASFLLVGDFNDTKDSSAVRRFISKGDKAFLKMIPTVDSREEKWTFYFAKKDLYERVDFLFASERMWPRVLKGEGHIVDRQPESGLGSDHRLIYTDIQFE